MARCRKPKPAPRSAARVSPRAAQPVRRRSQFLPVVLILSIMVPLATLLALRAANVELGQGYFFLRYSTLHPTRFLRALPLVVVVALSAGAILFLAPRRNQIFGHLLAGAALVCLVMWIWWAPPSPVAQQSFNYRSLSHDGAFVVEAENLRSLPEYLRSFDEKRLTRSIDKLGGTRVLSNPPGPTILCYAVIRMFPSWATSTNPLEQMLMRDYDVAPVDVEITANAIRISAAFTLLWALSSIPAYFLARLFVAQSGAVLFAAIVTFNPSAVHFTPGKDSVQLLTINAMLWTWFLGRKRKSLVFSGLSGAILCLGATLGLIHFWIALAMIAATVWQDRKFPLKQIAWFIGGFFAIVALVYFAIGWNIPATLFAVARRFAEVQKTFQMSHLVWYFIGLPIFLLFLSPGTTIFAAFALRRPHLNLGTRLALCTAAVMLFTYLLGITYELPRLWVAFIPPLTLGLMINRPFLKQAEAQRSDASDRATKLLILLVITQIIFTAYHWTILDARESEYRLLSQRLFQ